MGTLVFQATLGGQVNLTGPNTASTFTISVPAVTGNMITSGDTGTVTNTMLAGSIANAKLLNSSVTIGSTTVSLGSTVTAFTGITTLSMSGNLTLSGGTANGVAYLNGSNVVTTGSALTFDGTTLTPNALTVTNAVTLSGGTANGVAYLNGSKVVTTGSALVFDGTNLGLNCTATPYAGTDRVFQINGGTQPSEVRLTNNTASTTGALFQQSGNDLYIWNIANSFMSFGVNASEQMRLTSTGLGIGTSSPAAKLNVVGADAAIVGLIAGATNGIRFIPKAASAEVAATDKTGSGSYQQLDLNGSLLTFLTSGTERMRLDSSGNLGVGTASPSASAIIDAQSTTKGVRFPNMTTTQKNAVSSPAAGLVVFDTTLAKLCVYSGSAWQTITSI